MNNRLSPTKGNLIAVKNSLEFAETGYELLDRKRNILIKETMDIMATARDLQERINKLFEEAYERLQTANVVLGVCDNMAQAVPVETGLKIKNRSVMGVEVPTAELDPTPTANYFGLYDTDTALDEAYFKFNEIKQLMCELAQAENGVYRLAQAIGKTQKRANALKNIVIPDRTETMNFITEALEEKEREDFSHMKVIKARKES